AMTEKDQNSADDKKKLQQFEQDSARLQQATVDTGEEEHNEDDPQVS
ncbi:unnamed protein product, partial [Didymodactylos carnosus]